MLIFYLRKQFCTLIFLLLVSTLFGQINDTTLLFAHYDYNKNIQFLSRVDNSIIQILNPNGFENRVGLVIDSIEHQIFEEEVYIKYIPINDQPAVLFTTDPAKEGYEQNYVLLNLLNGDTIPVNTINAILEYSDGNFYGGRLNYSKYDGYGDYITNLESLNFKNNSTSTITKFVDDPEEAEGIVDLLHFRSSNKLVVNKAYCYVPLSGCDPGSFFIIDLNSKEKHPKLLDSVGYEVLEKWRDGKGLHFLLETTENDYIIDDEGRFTLVLPRDLEMVGWNYQNGLFHSYNVISRSDSTKYTSGKFLKKIIIPFQLSYALETILSNIYNNQIINKEMIATLSLSELLIAKNMVFAKHNYAFNSEFYQAYFNLFEFYNSKEMLSSRTRDVNTKLSAIDKENLALITKYLK